MKTVLMSIKPRHSRRIFEGTKRFELRRMAVRFDPGDIIVVYESHPTKAIVGAFAVAKVHRGTVEQLWERIGEGFGVSLEGYRSYFKGAQTAHAIEVGRRVAIDPVPLVKLRERHAGFRPPQSYMFWHRPLEQLIGTVETVLLMFGRTKPPGELVSETPAGLSPRQTVVS